MKKEDRKKPEQPSLHIEGILFDVYNTLVSRKKSDYQKLLTLLPPGSTPDESLKEIARATVMDFYRENRHQEWALSNNNQFWYHFYELYVSALGITDPDNQTAHHLADWSRDPHSFVIAPHAIDVIDELKKRGYRVGLLSNWDVTLPQFCDELGFAAKVDMILASDSVGIRKPAPEIFIEGCRRLGIAPEHCLYLGDSLNKDVAGSKAAGLHAGWYHKHNSLPEFTDKTKPLFTFNDFRTLLEILPGPPMRTP